MIAERLAAFRTRFLERSRGEGDALLRVVAAERPDFALIAGIAHRLAGGGGTVGLPAISAAAAALEDACDLRDADTVRAAAARLHAVIAEEAG